MPAEVIKPTAEIRLEGRTLVRSHVQNDWGSRLHWKILRNGAEVATPEARTSSSYTFQETIPGSYEVVLETWQHEGYQSKALGQYIEISNRVAVTV